MSCLTGSLYVHLVRSSTCSRSRLPQSSGDVTLRRAATGQRSVSDRAGLASDERSDVRLMGPDDVRIRATQLMLPAVSR